MKKGFTLIELLAVIIILAVVAIIATPVVLNVVNDAKESAAKSQANLILDGARNYYAESIFDNNKKNKIDNLGNIYDDVEMSGKKPENGKLYVNKKGLTALAVVINNKCYKKEFGGDLKIIDSTDCDLGYIGHDEVNPTIEFNVIGDPFNDNGWANQDFYVNINVIDNESGAYSYKWCSGINDCEPLALIEESNGNVLVSTESVNTIVCAIGYDKAGNLSDKTCSDTYKLDKQKPILNIISENIEIVYGNDNLVSSYFNVSYGISEGNLSCTPENTNGLSMGTHVINCMATGINGLTEVITKTITVKEKKNIDIVLDVGDTSITDLNIIESKANEILIPALEASGFRTNIVTKTMKKSLPLHNMFSYLIYCDKNETYSIYLYNPVNKINIKLKEFSKSYYKNIKAILMGYDGYIYYIYNNTLNKIDPITKQETVVLTSSAFTSVTNFNLGLDNKLYLGADSRIYVYDFSTNTITTVGNYINWTINQIAVDANSNIYVGVYQSSRYKYLYKVDKDTNTLVTVGNSFDAQNGMGGPYISTDNSKIFMYANKSYIYITNLATESLLESINSADSFKIGLGANGKVYYQTDYAQTGTGSTRYYYYYYLSSEVYLGSSTPYETKRYLGYGLDHREYFSDNTSHERNVFSQNGDRIENITGQNSSSWDNTYTIPTFYNANTTSNVKTSYGYKTWTNDSERFYVTLHDDYFGQMFVQDEYNSVADKLNEDQARFVSFGSVKNKAQSETLINNVDAKGMFINNVDIEETLITFRNYILSQFDY